MLAVLTSSKPGFTLPVTRSESADAKVFRCLSYWLYRRNSVGHVAFCSFVVWHWKHKNLKEKEKKVRENYVVVGEMLTENQRKKKH